MLDCCVQQVNGLFAPSSPWRKGHTDFQRLGEALRRLQAQHAVTVHSKPEGGHELVFAVPSTEEDPLVQLDRLHPDLLGTSTLVAIGLDALARDDARVDREQLLLDPRELAERAEDSVD